MTLPACAAESLKAFPPRHMVGCAAVFSLGNMVGWLTPQITAGTMHQFGTLAARAGLPVMFEGLTIGLVTVLLGTRPPRLTHRSLAVSGLILLISTNTASFWASSFDGLLGIRVIAGIGDALLSFVAVSLVAMQSRNPDRAYSVLTVVAVIVGACVVTAPPLTLPAVTGLAYLPLLAAVALLFAPLLAFLPKDSIPGVVSTVGGTPMPPSPRPDNRIIFAILVAFMVPASFQSFMTFAFSPGLGERLGLSEQTMNSVLGAATFASVLGPLMVGPVTRWLGHWGSMALGAALLLAVNLIVVMTRQPELFCGALICNLVLLYFCIPVLLGWAAELDPRGRFSSIMMGAVTLVTALSPSLAGEFVDHGGLASLTRVVVVAGILFLALLLVIPLLRRYRVRESSLPT